MSIKEILNTERRWSQTLDQDDSSNDGPTQVEINSIGSIQIFNTCRVCMKSHVELKSIYTKRNESLIVDLISSLTESPIFRNDGLPEQICEDCFHRVGEANETRNLCRSSDDELKKMLMEIKLMSEAGGTSSDYLTCLTDDQKPAENNKRLQIIKTEPSKDHNSNADYDEMIVEALDSSTSDEDDETVHPTNETYGLACCMCVNAFDTEEALLAHVASCHIVPPRAPQPGKTVECRLCLKRFTRIKNYNSHIKAMYEEKVLCPICGNAMMKRFLAEHILGHESPGSVVAKKKKQGPKKRYTRRDKQCMECGKCFFYNAQLQTHHRAVHQGEKPFTCEICGAAYPYKDSLTTHLLKHNAERKYKCQLCPASYIYRADLHAHMRRHNNGDERNFTCPICDCKFFTAKQLKAHTLTHDPQSSWKCDLCDKSYRQQYTLAKHKFSEHQIPMRSRKSEAIDSTSAEYEDAFAMEVQPAASGRSIEMYETVDVKCNYFNGQAEHYIIFQNE